MTQTRQPAGIPTGGQFAAGSQGRADVALGETTLAKQIGTRAYEPEPGPALPPQPTDRRGIWSVADHGGSPALRQRQLTALAVVDEMSSDRGSAQRHAIQFAAEARPMTVLCGYRNGSVMAIEGRGVIDRHGNPCLLLKGSRTEGVDLDGDDAVHVVSAVSTFNAQHSLSTEFHRHLAKVPELAPTAFDGIPKYEGGEPPDEIAAVFMVDGPDVTGDGPARGCLFFATDIQSDAGIVNGYHWFPRGSGLIPEHGSMYVRDIEATGGRVVGYEPGALSFGDLLNKKLPRSRVEAYRAVQGQTYYDE